ncbi:MAG: hypothetical protein GX448_11110 [Planctomycetes bacterium]|nr:hypothetical protein [Planctomycetota bacterium]
MGSDAAQWNTGTCLSVFAVLRAAQECESFEQAASRLQAANLGEILAGSEVLRAAWDRGRFLRRLAELGRTPFCRAEVAKRIGLADEAALQELLRTDAEAADVFQRARDELCIQARSALTKSAEAGHVASIRALERLLRAEAGGGGGSEDGGSFDPTRVAPTTLAKISGIAPMQWSRWVNAGLPRSPDGTFSLPTVFTWLRRNPQRTGTRRYRQKPSAVVQRLQQKINRVIEQELKGQHDETIVAPAGR